MSRIRYSSAARADLDEIYAFSFERFGEQQADRYFQRLDDIFVALIDMPEMGRVEDPADPGLRTIRVQSHVVYYRPKDYVVRIVRVLHASMSPEGRLDVDDGD